jgi:multidrug efflux pump subunit AcrA (membrane-fusion protein)
MKKQIILAISSIALVLLLAGCGIKTAAPLETAQAPAPDTVIAEGHFVPQEILTLSFQAHGKVSEITVKQGDKVSEDQVLARLGDNQQTQAALTAANFELYSAKQAADILIRTAGLARAQAFTAYINAQKISLVSQLVYDRLDLSAIQTSIDDAQKVVDTRLTELEKAQADFDEYKDLPPDDADRKTYEDKLNTAQTHYDDALRLLLIQTNRLDEPKAALDTALGIEAEAKRTYENTKEGPDTDKNTLAQARLDNALAQVTAAQNALGNYELKAPFKGTVADINVSLNQQAGPETWAVVLIDDRQWYVETSDLTEYDVVRVNVGDSAKIKIDALPQIEMAGVVEDISIAPKTQAGDVIYTVRLRIDNPDPLIRWGMTMEVTFPVNK